MNIHFKRKKLLPDWLVSASMFHGVVLIWKPSLGNNTYGTKVKVEIRVWVRVTKSYAVYMQYILCAGILIIFFCQNNAVNGNAFADQSGAPCSYVVQSASTFLMDIHKVSPLTLKNRKFSFPVTLLHSCVSAPAILSRARISLKPAVKCPLFHTNFCFMYIIHHNIFTVN